VDDRGSCRYGVAPFVPALAGVHHETPLMSSKFAQFLEKNKIDSRRLLAASHELEQLRREDRVIKFAKQRAKAPGAPAAAEGEKPKKPRSGRPVTPRLLEAAKTGKPVTGPAKSRLLRALNHVLGQKKQEAVDLRAIF
jgi:hypothetical protein